MAMGHGERISLPYTAILYTTYELVGFPLNCRVLLTLCLGAVPASQVPCYLSTAQVTVEGLRRGRAEGAYTD